MHPLPPEEKARRAAEKRIQLLVPTAIADIERILLPLSGAERKQVMKAIKRRGLL